MIKLLNVRNSHRCALAMQILKYYRSILRRSPFAWYDMSAELTAIRPHT